jgi:hypothetical protein
MLQLSLGFQALYLCIHSVNTLERAVDRKTDMRSVRVIRHANRVQLMEPQEDHNFLSPLSPWPFNFGYRCLWLDQCILTYGTFSRSLAHSSQVTLFIHTYVCVCVVGRTNNLYLTISWLKLLCDFHTTFEMWIVILNRRDYLEDITINGKIELHLDRRVLGIVGCIRLTWNRDQRWNVLNTLMKPSMP